ncbi:MAG: tRNA dihydrouridine synthase DusB [Calditrichia bacterium]
MNFIKSLTIGSLKTRHNLLVAPLAGISDFAFREICRNFGADLTFSEMVSIDGIIYDNEATRRLLEIQMQEHPVGFQFFGSDPELFRQVIPRVEHLGAAVIDLNFGCPVRKVVNKGAGAALLKNLGRLAEIVEAVRSVTDLPVTVKLRIGWDKERIVAVEAACAAEAAGAMAVTVHGRTRSQGYSGSASWDEIAAVKTAVRIPVIGNGDVVDAVSARDMFRQTGVDGIMLARGILGKPWVLRDILDDLSGRTPRPVPSLADRLEIMQRHYRLELNDFSEFVALSRMKKHFSWYTHGVPHAARLRNRIFRADRFEQVLQIFDDFRLEAERQKLFETG